MPTSDLLDRLNRELCRVASEVRDRERDSRGLLSLKSGMEGLDIYAHPSAIMSLTLELAPYVQFKMDDPKKMPRDAFGKYHDCWVFVDAQQPEGALIIRHNGNVYADVPISPPEEHRD